MIQTKHAMSVRALAIFIACFGASLGLVRPNAFGADDSNFSEFFSNANSSSSSSSSSVGPGVFHESHEVKTNDDLEMFVFLQHAKDLVAQHKDKPDAASCPGDFGRKAWEMGYLEASQGEDYDSLCEPRNSPSRAHLNCENYRDPILREHVAAELKQKKAKKVTVDSLLNCCRVGYYTGLDRLERYLTKTYNNGNLSGCRAAVMLGAQWGVESCSRCFVPNLNGAHVGMLGCLTIGYLKAVIKNCPMQKTAAFAKRHAPTVYNHGKASALPSPAARARQPAQATGADR